VDMMRSGFIRKDFSYEDIQEALNTAIEFRVQDEIFKKEPVIEYPGYQGQ